DGRRLCAVTLAGEVLTTEGLLTGGTASDAGSSVLARKNQTLALEEEVTRLRASHDGIVARQTEILQRMEIAQVQLTEAREEKQNATVRLGTLQGQLQMIDSQLTETTRRSESLEWEHQSAESRRSEAAAKVAELEGEIRGAMDAFENAHARRTEAQGSLEMLRSRENEIAGELNDLKIKVATERQRHSSLHHQRQPMEARIAELSELIDQRQRDVQGYEERSGALEAEKSEIEANMERLRGSIGEATEHVATVQEERKSVVAAAEEMAERMRHLRRDQSHCMEQRGAIEVRSTQLELKANSIDDHIQKRYQLTLREFVADGYALASCMREIGKRVRKLDVQAQSEAAGEGSGDASTGADAPVNAESTETADISSEGSELAEEVAEAPVSATIDWFRIETIVRELDTRLAGMGPVNLDAIAEFEELEQRHTFLETQIADTIAAKDELLGVINKINTTTKTLFADTFEKIRVNFQEMFRELFGGGQANLVLTMEDDPLESGIEIIAKPPGKQLQSISLLSGGERTMTAVALLFSIYMVKPSPFCV
ncbi:MAG: hypothetical protein ABIP85_28280, partial [Chthoniobacteraceae bacterium]